MLKFRLNFKAMAKDYTRLKGIAKEFFLAGKEGKEISELVGISENTISKWRNEGATTWDQEREALEMTPTRIRLKLLQEAKNLSEGEVSTIPAKQLNEIMKIITALEKKLSVQVVAEVLMEFDRWYSKINPKKAPELCDAHREFITHRISMEING